MSKHLDVHRKKQSPTQSRQTSPDAPVASALGPQTPMPPGYGHDFRKIAIFPQLEVNAPGDRFEREADQTASQVVARIALANQSAVQREEEEEKVRRKPLDTPALPVAQAQQNEEVQTKRETSLLKIVQRVHASEDEEELHRKPLVQRASAEGGFAVEPEVEQQIEGARGGGSLLSVPIRSPMEQAFGADFSGVRVHTDGQSDQLNRSVSARAFTTGSDIFFRSGEYAPGSQSGQELLAHELTHVVQQGAAVQRKPVVSDGSSQVIQRAPPSAAAPAAPASGSAPGAAGTPVVVPNIAWGMKVTPGGEGAGQPRDLAANKIFKGDKVRVSAEFQNIPDPQAANLHMTQMSMGKKDPPSLSGNWVGKNYVWEFAFTSVGSFSTFFTAQAPGAPDQEHQEQFQIVADLQDFILACTQAQADVNSKFSAASSKMNQAANAYHQAFEDQKAALKEVEQGEKMEDDLLWGAFFAALGGGAGGAVGGWLKTLEGSAVVVGAITDTAKDLTKFAVRSGQKLAGGGATKTSGDSTSATDPPVTGGKGEKAAQGKEPFVFLTGLAAALENEKSGANGQLRDLILRARQARDANTKADFDEDPVEIVNRDIVLDALTSDLNTEKIDYLRSLWHTWIANYAYKVEVKGAGPSGEDSIVTVDDNIGSKKKKAIDKAAAQCGEKGEDWINTYAPQAKQKAEAEAARQRQTIKGGK